MSIQQVKWSNRKTETLARGADLAARWFGMDEAAVETACGLFARGANAGKVRGWIVWQKAEVGGWSFAGQGVVRPGVIMAVFCKTYDEACRVANLSPRDFLASAQRVDRCYGHDPLAPQTSPFAPREDVLAEMRAKDTRPMAEPAADAEWDKVYDAMLTAMKCPFFNATPDAARYSIARTFVKGHRMDPSATPAKALEMVESMAEYWAAAPVTAKNPGQLV